MATYYVNPSGSNTAPYDTWAKAANAFSTIVPDLGTLPCTVYIAPGTYNEQMYLNGVRWENSTIIGVSSTVFMGVANLKDVVFSVASSFAGRFGAVNVTTKGLSFISPSGNTLYIQGAGFIGEKCYIESAGGMLFDVSARLNSCTIEGSGTSHLVRNAANVSFENCIIKHGKRGFYTQEVFRITTSGVVEIDNCLVCGAGLGSAGTILLNNALGKITIKNSTVFGGAVYSPLFNNAAGVLEYGNCVLVPSWSPTSGYVITAGICTDLGENIIAPSGVLNQGRNGLLSVNIDDINVTTYDSVNYVLALLHILRRYGARMTWFLNADGLPGNESDVLEIIGSGIVDIGSHSYSHSNLTISGNAFSITKTGHTISVDRINDQIVVAGSSPVTVAGFKDKTLSAIKAELTVGGCTCGDNAPGLYNTLGESLAATSGPAASPYTTQLLIDTTANTGYFYVELSLSKQLIESTLGVPVRSIATPGGVQSANVITAIKAAGYEAGRYSTGSSVLSAINLASLQYRGLGNFAGATQDETKRNIGLLADASSLYGLAVNITAHGLSDGTLEDWDFFLSEISKYKFINLCSVSEIIDYVKESGAWSTSDGYTYTRAEWDEFFDFRLTPTSPCIGAGVDVGLTTDADGNAVPGALGYDIGPYSYMPGWTPFDGSMPDLALASTCPGDLKQVQAWKKVASAKEIGKY